MGLLDCGIWWQVGLDLSVNEHWWSVDKSVFCSGPSSPHPTLGRGLGPRRTSGMRIRMGWGVWGLIAVIMSVDSSAIRIPGVYKWITRVQVGILVACSWTTLACGWLRQCLCPLAIVRHINIWIFFRNLLIISMNIFCLFFSSHIIFWNFHVIVKFIFNWNRIMYSIS